MVVNVIITHSKFISSPSICLFATIIPTISPSFAFLYRDDTVVTAVEINECDACHSVDKLVHFLNLQVKVLNPQVKVLGSLLFYTINC